MGKNTRDFMSLGFGGGGGNSLAFSKFGDDDETEEEVNHIIYISYKVLTIKK